MEAFLQCCHLMQRSKITMPFETNSSALKRLKHTKRSQRSVEKIFETPLKKIQQETRRISMS